MAMGRSNRESASNEPGQIRTFICVEIPEAIKERIALLQREMRQTDAQVSWAKPENIHLTIKFLGNVAQSKIQPVCRAVERAAASIEQFEIEIAGAGCFPSPRNARVLWVGLAELPGALKRLHASVEDELAREGFPREPKRFSPHLTIARIRSLHGAGLLAEQLIARSFEPESFTAREVIVMRSDLKPTGSIYTPLAVIPLGR